MDNDKLINEELSYIEIGFKNITTYGHTKSTVFKL